MDWMSFVPQVTHTPSNGKHFSSWFPTDDDDAGGGGGGGGMWLAADSDAGVLWNVFHRKSRHRRRLFRVLFCFEMPLAN